MNVGRMCVTNYILYNNNYNNNLAKKYLFQESTIHNQYILITIKA